MGPKMFNPLRECFFAGVWATVAVLAFNASTSGQEREQPPLVPDQVELSAVVRAAVDAPSLSEAERRHLQIFHGLHSELNEATRRSPQFLLDSYDLLNPALSDANTPPLIRAEAAFLRGDLESAIELLKDDESPRATLLRGKAYEASGKFDLAVKTLTPLREKADAKAFDTAEDLAAAGEAIVILAILEGRPASDYQTALDLFNESQQKVDRLYWPALIAQARLLIEKDNPAQAVPALHEALRLNPRSSEAWSLLGRIATQSFDFASVQKAIAKLREISPRHPLADELEVEMYLTQKDPDSAEKSLLAALQRYPNHRRLLAAAAAVAALKFDPVATDAALKKFDAVSPGHPLALYLTGKYLSMARQYEAGEKTLRAAIERQPNWSEPRVELGLMLNQAGKDAEALEALRAAARLDSFDKRAVNTLKLHEQIAGYKKIETEHFIVRYGDDLDAALAADMPEILEEIYRDITTAYGHRPSRKTQIEILPDKRWFAVRITGMPWIWTIGASTGPVIAITPPREGKHHAGTFDWARVIRHEFVHTVTLSQTDNRVAHWFTEACAVSQEPGPRDFPTSAMLASALAKGQLFNLEEINWAFIRPKRPNDRDLAYAQSHWMHEYITRKYGHAAVLRILELSGQGVPHAQSVPKALGISAEQFLSEFKAWAAQQVHSWGLSPQPSTEEIAKQLKEATANLDPKLDELLAKHPDHPDVLRVAAERSLDRGDDRASLAMLLRYATARPIDPWADRRIAEVAVRLGEVDKAISHLEQLDRFDQSSGDHAHRLSELYRKLGQLDNAQSASTRAIHRKPYDPSLREAAATIALQRRDNKLALHHLRALTLLEPDRALHHVRLAALLHRMGQLDESDAEANKAQKLDPDAAVKPFLK